MSEQTTSKKMPFGERVKEHFNYPMLLLAIITIVNLRNIISSFIGIFSCLFTFPLSVFSAILSFLLSATPAILLLLLWLQRFEKIKKVNFLMGGFLIFIVLATIYRTYPTIIYFFSNISQYDAYTLFNDSPFLIVLNTILELVTYTFLAIIILANKKTPALYYILIVLCISTTLFLGILTQMIISSGYSVSSGGLMQAFINVLTYMAFWYIPKALVDSHSTDINPAQRKVLIAITAVTLFVFVVSSLAVDDGNSSSSVSTNTCGYCGRSYEAGDAGGNYMSIASSGLCKNCNGNREYFDWIFD